MKITKVTNEPQPILPPTVWTVELTADDWWLIASAMRSRSCLAFWTQIPEQFRTQARDAHHPEFSPQRSYTSSPWG